MPTLLSNLSIKDIELYVLSAVLIVTWLAILIVRKRPGKEASGQFERHKGSNISANDPVLDFSSISSQLAAIHQFVMSAVEIGSKEGLARALVDLALKITRSGAGCVLLVEPSKVDLLPAASRGMNGESINIIKAKLAQSMSGSEIKAGNPIFMDASGNKAVSVGMESVGK